MPDVLVRLRARIEAACLAHGLAYPWWVPVVSHVSTVVCVVLTLGVRGQLWPVGLPYLAIVLVSIGGLADLWLQIWLPWYLDIGGGLLVAVWLLNTHPAHGDLDLAAALLMFLTAETTARDGLRIGAVAGVVGGGVIVEAAVATSGHNVTVELLAVVLGYVVAAMVRWQMRALVAEREAREQTWQNATAAERQRIAREIHDLVAHSLSVTLLQVTGARHLLKDISDETRAPELAGTLTATLAEADEALADAEQVGRKAMADIRRTVSTLAEGPSSLAPLPAAADIAGLVEQFRGAGLEVEYDESGDLGGLPDSVGLGLFRIAQESLSNAAKHGTGPVSARLRVDASRVVLEVVNAAVPEARRGDGLGSGLAGMRARADDLGASLIAGPSAGPSAGPPAGVSAGPAAGGWRVELVVPLARRGLLPHCPVIGAVSGPASHVSQTSPAAQTSPAT